LVQTKLARSRSRDLPSGLGAPSHHGHRIADVLHQGKQDDTDDEQQRDGLQQATDHIPAHVLTSILVSQQPASYTAEATDCWLYLGTAIAPGPIL
jgi:hypothetical protein